MQKARRHRTGRLRPLAGAWFQGLFHSSARGSFHLSLTVLVHCRFSLAGWSPRFRAGFLVSCATQVAASASGARFAYGALTLYGRRFHAVRLRCRKPFPAAPTTPEPRRHGPGLGSSAFARRYSRNHCYFLFLRVLRCFSSPRWPRLKGGVPTKGTGYPIRTSADRAVFAGPRGFSQLVTSFIASGSHRHPPCALFRFPFFLLIYISS